MAENKIILRALELQDIDIIYKYENDTTAWSDGITNRFYSKYAIEQYIISSQNEDIFTSNQSRMMIDIVTTNQRFTVGCIDLYDIDYRHSRAGVGIYIDKDYRNKKYASKAIDELENYACNVLNLHQLYAFISEDNISCQKAFENCNYKMISKLKDWLKIGNNFKNVDVYQKIITQ